MGPWAYAMYNYLVGVAKLAIAWVFFTIASIRLGVNYCPLYRVAGCYSGGSNVLKTM